MTDEPVIGDTRLFTEDGYLVIVHIGFIDQLLDKAMAHHSVADDGQSHSAHKILYYKVINSEWDLNETMCE